VSLKLPYKKYPTTLTKCGYFYSASIPVNIALPAKNSPRSKRFDAIIDSGASTCLFHASIGEAIGLDIEKGDLTQTMGIAGGLQIYVHDISLYAPEGIIMTRAGFSRDLPLAGLLGMDGFF
jgi:Aspartyl protease